jgi:hypothetical protein
MGNNRGTVFLLGAAVSGWMICDMVDELSQTLVLIKYVLLAVAVITTLYSGAKWLTLK